jgi:protein arginine kinase activator
MLCERCRNSEATIHHTEIIKDVKSELHLCEKSSRDIGLNAKLSNFSLSIPEMLSFLDENEGGECHEGSVCATCGVTFMDYSREGRLGCPDCYEYLGESLQSVIAGYHGATRHAGKHPHVIEDSGVRDRPRSCVRPAIKTVEEYRHMLEQAVLNERYEEAAVLRDAIRELESQGVKRG